MIAMLNKGVTPFIPEKGSLGASGDLAPLSHMVLPMIGPVSYTHLDVYKSQDQIPPPGPS